MTKMTYTVGMHEAPAEVWVANTDGSGEKKITDIMADTMREIAFSRADRLKWKSYDGTEIEGSLTHPHGYNRSKGPYPMIVFSHGGQHSGVGYGFSFKQQYFAANGYFVFDTNFRSSTGYGDAFKWATWGAWGTKDGQDVISGIDHVIAKETEFFGTPWSEDAVQRMVAQSPLTRAGRVRTPTLFIHGEEDQRVPYEEGEQMYLRRQGVGARMIQYAGQPHGISGHWNNVHRMINELKWFDLYMKKPAAGTSSR